MTDTYTADASGNGPLLGEPVPKAPPKPVSSKEEVEKLSPGTEFVGPDGEVRVVPYKVKQKSDINNVPDGADFVGPDGELRVKPKYEGVDFTAETLYRMAHSDKGRKAALERSYPGKVRGETADDFYVEDEGGKMRKPGRGLNAATGFMASEALPTVGAVGGSLLGGAVGTLAEPGGGTLVGGAAGGYGGAYLGQGMNDIVSQLAGVYDPEGAEENKRHAGYAGAAGDVSGRTLSAIAPTLKEGATVVGRNASKFVNSFLGTDKEALPIARKLAEEGESEGSGILGKMGLRKPGTATSPSAVFKEAPHISNLTETLDSAFHTQKPLRQSAEAHMERKGGEILEQLGVKPEGSLLNPTAAVSTEEPGRAIIAAARERSAEADAQLRTLLETRREGAAATAQERSAQVEATRQAAERSAAAAQKLVDQGFKDIEQQADDAMRVAGAGHNSGDIWRSVANSFTALREGIQTRAQKMYGDAEVASGGHIPQGAASLADTARTFMAELPEGFEQAHPSIVKKLRDMAGVVDEKTGQTIKEPVEATWAQLHALRTQMRQNIKWNDLSSDTKNGTYKFFNNRLNDVLHDADAVPELKEASRLLKIADKFYSENMGPLNNRQIQALVDGLKSGLVADPKALLNAAIKEGRTEVAELIKKTVGPQTWNAMRAADVKEMLAQSGTLAENGAIDARKFAKQVLDRKNNGVLEVLHGTEGAGRLLEQARQVEQLAGRLEIQPKPGDTVNDIILRARQAAKEAEAAAKANPLGTLKKEMQGILKDHSEAKKKMLSEGKDDPLSFLLNPTVQATEAVNRILGNEDMIIAASRAFNGGEKSPEFELLRQVWAQRFLEGTMEPGKKLAATSKEVQALMFPGVTLDSMHTLAKEMELLMSGKSMGGQQGAGNSMMATAAVEHPFGAATGFGKLAGPTKLIPGANAGMRATLGAYYSTMRELMTSPSTLRWLEKGLKSRDPEARESARQAIRVAMQRGGAMGAGGAESVYQGQ